MELELIITLKDDEWDEEDEDEDEEWDEEDEDLDEDEEWDEEDEEEQDFQQSISNGQSKISLFILPLRNWRDDAIQQRILGKAKFLNNSVP